MDMVISDLESFAAGPSMREVVRSGIADIVEVPPAFVHANMTIPEPASYNRTRVDYAVDIPFKSSQKDAAQSLEDAIEALMNTTSAAEEVTAFMSDSVDRWLGQNIYSIAVLSMTRPVMEVLPARHLNQTEVEEVGADA
eukprot:UN4423